MPADPLALGIDYGTLSGRVLVLELTSGAELACAEVRYRHGVIDEQLPGSDERLPAGWALQHPRDYLEVIESGIPQALAEAGVDPARVVGLGIDFTSCTVLPTRRDGTPLCELPRWRGRPHAWPKLWKHHAAQPQADRLTQVALERDEPFIARYGQRISSEWYFPKLLQIFAEDRELYEQAEVFIEATDWVVWQLTGVRTHNACAASYKAFAVLDRTPPSAAYFEAVAPGFGSAPRRLPDTFAALGARAGTLRPDLAERLGLDADVAVAVGNVDSFVSVPGAGIEQPGVFVSVIGTSICDMVVHPNEILMPGITGVVRDGILPGLYGYEAGQPAVGDMLDWWANGIVPSLEQRDGTLARQAVLEHEAQTFAPGATGLLALDWWNGNRSILADSSLSGVLVGVTLATTSAEIYRALLESIAFGSRRIIDNFEEHGLALTRIVACGGIPQKSAVLMQTLADVTGREVAVPASAQIPARGAAMFGAVAAGPLAGGFSGVREATAALRPASRHIYTPDRDAGITYDRVYTVYRELHDILGRDHVTLLRTLAEIRRGR